MLRTSIDSFIASVLMVLALAAPASLRAQESKVIDRIVAVVGNEIITESELDMQLLQASMRDQIDMNSPAARRQMLDAMMNDKLILAQAEIDSVQVPPEEVTMKLDQQIKQLIRYYGSEQRLEQEAHMPIAQIKREFRDNIEKRLKIETLQRTRFGNVEASHRDVVDFYNTYKDSLPRIPEQVHLRQIAVFPKVVESFRETAREKAEAILDSIRAGADFGEMARKYSDDAGSARNGGDLGMARRGLFVKEFEEAAFALEPGEVSGVVETPFGFHIIKLLEKKGEAIHPLHILIRVEKTGESDQGAIDELKKLKTRIEDGEDFEELAKKYSEDKETAKFGGDLGTLEMQDLSDEVRTHVQDMKEGAISDPFKITIDRDYAYAIVQLVERIAPHEATLERDYQRIALFARAFKQNKLYADWINEIKQNVYWKVNM
jgi:peptidyl-prolyl cis-trans isomerase SurA